MVANDTTDKIEQVGSLLGAVVVIGGFLSGLMYGVLRWGRKGVLCINSTYRIIHFLYSIAHRRNGHILLEFEKTIAESKELRIRVEETERLLGIGIFTADASQSIDWITPQGISLFGCDSTDIIGRYWLVQITDESRDRLESKWNLACSKRIGTTSEIVTIRGTRLLLDIQPSVNDENEVVSVYCKLMKV